MNWLPKLFQRVIFWHSKQEPLTSSPPAPVRMFELLNEAHALFQANKIGEAESLLLEALQEPDADTLSYLAHHAVTYLQLIWITDELYKKGITFFTNRMRRYPSEVLAYNYRAAHLWYNAQQSEALLDCSRVLELAPDDLWALVSRGQVYVEVNQPEKAVEDLNRALQIPNAVPNVREQNWSEAQAYARNGLGTARAMLGDFRSAFREFDLSIDLQPENGWVYFNRAQARERMGDNAAALADYKKSVSCSKPKLAAFKREFAETKIRELGR